MTSKLPARPLSELLAGLDVRLPASDPLVSGVAFDSRRVRPGFLYVGLPGTSKHGAAFAGKAATAGAAALLTDAAGARLIESEGLATPPVAMVEDARYAMAIASCRSYGQPARP